MILANATAAGTSKCLGVCQALEEEGLTKTRKEGLLPRRQRRRLISFENIDDDTSEEEEEVEEPTGAEELDEHEGDDDTFLCPTLLLLLPPFPSCRHGWRRRRLPFPQELVIGDSVLATVVASDDQSLTESHTSIDPPIVSIPAS
jgi:hypothetical protein